MNNVTVTVLSALISGLVGVLVGAFIDRHYEKRRDKIEILKTLVTYREAVTNPERISALNCIPIIFSLNKNICEALDKYKEAQDVITDNLANHAVLPQKFDLLNDSYIKLIEQIAVSLRMSLALSWDKLKKPYAPRCFIDLNGFQQWY